MEIDMIKLFSFAAALTLSSFVYADMAPGQTDVNQPMNQPMQATDVNADTSAKTTNANNSMAPSDTTNPQAPAQPQM